MSEKFGLNWRKEPVHRTQLLYTVYTELSKEEKRKTKEANAKKR